MSWTPPPRAFPAAHFPTRASSSAASSSRSTAWPAGAASTLRAASFTAPSPSLSPRHRCTPSTKKSSRWRAEARRRTNGMITSLRRQGSGETSDECRPKPARAADQPFYRSALSYSLIWQRPSGLRCVRPTGSRGERDIGALTIPSERDTLWLAIPQSFARTRARKAWRGPRRCRPCRIARNRRSGRAVRTSRRLRRRSTEAREWARLRYRHRPARALPPR